LVEQKTPSSRSDYVWLILRIAIGFIFAYAGFMKLIEPVENFEAAITDFNLFSPSAIHGIARVVPWIELMGGTFLLLGYLPKMSAAAVGTLAFGFVVLLGISVLNGKGSQSCGCFGESGIKLTRNQMFILDLSVFLIAFKLFRKNKFTCSLHSALTS